MYLRRLRLEIEVFVNLKGRRLSIKEYVYEQFYTGK